MPKNDYIRSVTPQNFAAWMQRKSRAQVDHIPVADQIVPMVAQAGTAGMARSELGHAVKLEPAVLDQLLDGLVRFGSLVMSIENGVRVFRSRPGLW
jgi:hypothetical protein